jgi:hypothetical protein
MADRLWWQKPMRIIQYNLQVKDAPLMNGEKIARQTEEMGGNVIVVNVGGVSAWYPSKTPYHHVNEYMGGRDITREIIDACHARDIKVIARFGFLMGADESIYHQKPQWFMRKPDGSPITLGSERPGGWSLLYAVCPNGGYSTDEVALPALGEVLDNYDIDGIFGLGGIMLGPCWCGVCKEKYLNKYGKELPNDPAQIDPDWFISTPLENTQKFWDVMREKTPEKPLISYYYPFEFDIVETSIHTPGMDRIEKLKTGNMLCSEAQDTLSSGIKNLPHRALPALTAKLGRSIEGMPNPLCIIHTCPGMDWRHSNLPIPEFLAWSAQVVASGGNYWASFTGIPDTNADKRILHAVKQINEMIAKVESDMDNADCLAKVLLLCDGDRDSRGWAEALLSSHIEFDMLTSYQLDLERLKRYHLLILPAKCKNIVKLGTLLEKYLAEGGRLIVEGTSGSRLKPLIHLLGVDGQIIESESMGAAYLRVEPASEAIHGRLGETELVPLRGKVGYCVPKADTKVYLTWVPPFAPTIFAGMPPERASLPAAQTSVPLCMVSDYKKGKVMLLPYEPGRLMNEYGLADFYKLMEAYFDMMLGEERDIITNAPLRVLVSIFKKDKCCMLHFINEVGQRPLAETIPIYGIKFSMRLEPGVEVKEISARISGQELPYQVDQGVLEAVLPQLDVWDMIRIDFK